MDEGGSADQPVKVRIRDVCLWTGIWATHLVESLVHVISHKASLPHQDGKPTGDCPASLMVPEKNGFLICQIFPSWRPIFFRAAGTSQQPDVLSSTRSRPMNT